jgi:hypothetical protein
MLQHKLPDLLVQKLEIRHANVDFVPPNTSSARASKRSIHSVIWVGCTPNCAANSASILLPLNVSKTT